MDAWPIVIYANVIVNLPEFAESFLLRDQEASNLIELRLLDDSKAEYIKMVLCIVMTLMNDN